MAMESQEVKIYISTATTVASTDTQISQVTDFTGPGGSANVIDITSLDSTAKEKMMGLADEGQLSMTLNYISTDAGQIAFRTDRAARTKRQFTMKFNDPATSKATFKGYPLQFSIAGAVDAKITANAVIEITGGVSYSTA
jgi:hypothetical protein